MTRTAGPKRPPTTLTTGALVLALAGLVAVISHGTSVWTPPRPGQADRLVLLGLLAAVIVLGLTVTGALALAVHRTVAVRRPDAPPLRSVLERALPLATVALVLVGLLVIARADLRPVAGAGDGARLGPASSGPLAPVLEILGWWDSPVKAGEGRPGPEGSGGGRDPDSGLPPLLVLAGGAAVVVGGAVWWYASSTARRAGGPPAEEEDHEVAHGAVMDTIDAMLADPDPNTAIIGAYARLLEGLAACGTPRRTYEGPMEHLRRVLAILQVPPGPLRRLVELFELARFSAHALTSSHREQALDALRAVATSLAADSGGSTAPPVTAGWRPVESGP